VLVTSTGYHPRRLSQGSCLHSVITVPQTQPVWQESAAARCRVNAPLLQAQLPTDFPILRDCAPSLPSLLATEKLPPALTELKAFSSPERRARWRSALAISCWEDEARELPPAGTAPLGGRSSTSARSPDAQLQRARTDLEGDGLCAPCSPQHPAKGIPSLRSPSTSPVAAQGRTVAVQVPLPCPGSRAESRNAPVPPDQAGSQGLAPTAPAAVSSPRRAHRSRTPAPRGWGTAQGWTAPATR